MKPAVEPSSVRVRWGPTARDLLAASPRGQVLAVMSQAVYLECESGELLWLTTGAAPMHWRAVVLQDAMPQPSARVAFAADGSGLTFKGGPSLRWAQAELWQPTAIPGSARARIQALPSRLGTLRSVLAALPSPRGFGVLLGSVLDGPRTLAAPSPVVADSPILRQALPAIQAMLGAIHEGDLDGALMLAESLLGLGEGLTPSGDDFVGGLLFGFAALHAVDPARLCFSPSALGRFVATARDRTNRISHTLLRDHAAGKASEPLHRHLAGLLEGESPRVLKQQARAAIEIGHSTGWDTLTGLWAALATIAPPGPALARG